MRLWLTEIVVSERFSAKPAKSPSCHLSTLPLYSGRGGPQQQAVHVHRHPQGVPSPALVPLPHVWTGGRHWSLHRLCQSLPQGPSLSLSPLIHILLSQQLTGVIYTHAIFVRTLLLLNCEVLIPTRVYYVTLYVGSRFDVLQVRVVLLRLWS